MQRTTLIMVLMAALSPAARSLTNVPANAVSSSKHYRTSGVGNATGRAGSASMTARALLGKDGNTTVEVTTGVLDSSVTPPGSFSKVQYKPLDSNGNALFAQNFNPASGAAGYYSFASPSLHRAEQIQLQGNIGGIDNRNDVVTLVETVKLRPDLAVQGLLLPNSAMVTTPVNISANIVELNGDASATTACVLMIDGNNVDQANNVYVDAGGSVSCAFLYTFLTTGPHTVQVMASSVIPSDWDTGNNSTSGTITVTNIGIAQHGEGYFSGYDNTFSGSSSTELWRLGVVLENQFDSTVETQHNQSTAVSFQSSGCAGTTNAVLWQFPVTLTYSETMDGAPVYNYTDMGIVGNTSSQFFPSGLLGCNNQTMTSVTSQYIVYYSVDHWNYLFAGEFYDASGNVNSSYQVVQSMRNAGDVSYFSSGYQCFYWTSPTGDCNSPSDYYAWNSSYEQTTGTVIPLGNTWVPSITTQDSTGNIFSGTISVPLATVANITPIQTNTCNNLGPDYYGYTYQTCTSVSLTSVQTGGSATQ
jgi:hypothetical protein